MLARACAQNYKTSRMRILRHELRRRATCWGAVDWVHPSFYGLAHCLMGGLS